jgi:Fur family transcriptional regulator, zinc uptake regulator
MTPRAHSAPALTAPQQAALASLKTAKRPMSAYALLDQLREKGFNAPTQVYRALDRLMEHGLVHRLVSLNAYVACRHSAQHRHSTTAFAICDQCGQVDELADDGLNRSLARLTKGQTFSVTTPVIELHGQCAHCLEHAAPTRG